MLGASMIGLSTSARPLSLALQGGGAHGAYTWGVLDALLEHTTHEFVALSGTSAGAVNAVVMAHGLLEAGREGARAALGRFWDAMGRAVSWDAMGLVGASGDRLTPAGRLMLQWASMFSPTQANPLRRDPLRDLLTQQVDFDRLRRQRNLRLFVAATHANSGRLRIFGNDELTADAVLASACLPTLQLAVSIDGEPYWDGGYSANPALFPLVYDVSNRDVLVVMLSPWSLGETPSQASEIRARAVEIAFNAAFLREMQWLASATEMARSAWWPGPLERRLRRLRWHLIDGHDDLSTLPAESKMLAHPQLLQRLCEAGRARATAWLDRHGDAIGARASADLQHLFGHHQPPADRS
jgi:NTE family protein